MKNKNKGKFAEKYIENYLRREKYKIITKNWYCRWGELDLIADKEGELVFIEVKYRTSRMYGYPSDSISKKKLKSLRRSSQVYLLNNEQYKTWRLDVICVFYDGELYVNHYKAVSV